MDIDKKETRWDIYLNGRDGLKESAHAMLTMWWHLFPACGEFGEALYEFFAATARVFIILVLPLLFWIAPITAIFTAHRLLTDEEIRAQLRAGIHKNGGKV
jgi:hypothetical protein